ncbi:bola (bacterial stress-induced morphogen)-related protein [Moesziomyces antarcticus T-34]|uniref:Bola (Bacterial stress-induced morphogen)-related protein n=1 Tax=Pseudozyma antarctica (strain T-34) TaxID=1151754 RepID=M9MD91_PSEA3|nr:bola (bacterial stress-induced morphogen)-related protein [Moesziomyces antarcticus T-34]
MVSSQELESAIRQKVRNVSTLVVSDVSGGCGQAYDVVIVSDAFEGLNTLKRHRMVNELLKDEIAQLHAFSQKTYTAAQYEQMSTSSSTPTPAAAAAKPTSADLQAPAPIITGGSRPSHNRTASGVSIPELTLTTDDDTLSGHRSVGKPLGGATAPGSATQYPGTAVPPPLSPSISRLHENRIRSTEFWTGLRSYLELQFSGPNVEAGAASPGPSGRSPGDAEIERIFEDFFLSQKHHLTASDIARVRDATGMFGMAGV